MDEWRKQYPNSPMEEPAMEQHTMTEKLNINGDQLWQSIHDMAQIGATSKGGVKRLAFTGLDRVARDRFIDDCIELGMEVSRDRIGNIFAVMAGTRPELPVVMVGSHLDSQPTGGKYDGPLGVLSALEIARTVYAAGRRPTRSLEIVSFANEEGARFAPPMMGSGVFAGKLDLEKTLDTTDFDGVTIREELGNDTTGDYPARPDRAIDAYFEIHIEQGPILEELDIPIGIVTGAQAQRWYDVTIIGMDSHAGPTPMTHRKDALVAAAELTLAVEQAALAHAPDGRGTVGTLSLQPFSRNVVPGRVDLTIDTRHPSEDNLLQMKQTLEEAVADIAQRRRVTITMEQLWHSPQRPFADELIDQLDRCTNQRGLTSHRMWSGAGHDAVYMASMGVPTAMVFVPTKDGISHNESESITKDHAVAGCQVMCDAVVERLFRES
ncbi:MAG: Zn-dependent hydrolase [Chloroflexota bacterium]